jgi:hypothetical protein
MMMGIGLLFMLVVIGVPVLIVALVMGGGLAALFKSRPRQAGPDTHLPSREPADERKCSTCGRAIRAGWNVCPTCGAALT